MEMSGTKANPSLEKPTTMIARDAARNGSHDIGMSIPKDCDFKPSDCLASGAIQEIADCLGQHRSRVSRVLNMPIAEAAKLPKRREILFAAHDYLTRQIAREEALKARINSFRKVFN